MRRYVNFMVILGCCWLLCGLADITLADSDKWESFNLEVDSNSNFIDLGFLNSTLLSNLGENIMADKSIPDQILIRAHGELFVPLLLQEGRGWGLFADYNSWGTASGDAARFYHDFEDDDCFEGGAYELNVKAQAYYSTGLYHFNRFEILQQPVISRQRFFVIKNFEEYDAVGQGILRINSTLTKEGELHAIYNHIYQTGQDGYGYGLDWSTKLNLQNGGYLDLKVINLPGYAYFPSLTYDNARGDAQQSDNSPIIVNGFVREKAVWIKLPLIAEVAWSYSLWGGLFDLSAVSIGSVADFTIGYGRSIKKITAKAAYNPFMKNISLGLAWSRGTFNILCSSEDGVFQGVLLKIY